MRNCYLAVWFSTGALCYNGLRVTRVGLAGVETQPRNLGNANQPRG